MTLYDAVSIAEGFCGYEPTLEQTLEAWAHLIKTGHCWELQGWFGRNATSLIDQNIISKAGEINWDAVADMEIA
jgi:hypothetical protein